MEARGLATTSFSRPEIDSSPAEMIAQHGSRPSWLRALLGKIRTTTAQANANRRALLTNFHELASSFIFDTPTDALGPVASGSGDCASLSRSVSTMHSGVPALLPPGAIQRQAFSPTAPGL